MERGHFSCERSYSNLLYLYLSHARALSRTVRGHVGEHAWTDGVLLVCVRWAALKTDKTILAGQEK